MRGGAGLRNRRRRPAGFLHAATGIVPIVVDHHPPHRAKPPTSGTLVNPWVSRGSEPGEQGTLCAAALTWFVALAILRRAGLARSGTVTVRKRITLLAALGTACDLMRLDTPFNRRCRSDGRPADIRSGGRTARIRGLARNVRIQEAADSGRVRLENRPPAQRGIAHGPFRSRRPLPPRTGSRRCPGTRCKAGPLQSRAEGPRRQGQGRTGRALDRDGIHARPAEHSPVEFRDARHRRTGRFGTREAFRLAGLRVRQARGRPPRGVG